MKWRGSEKLCWIFSLLSIGYCMELSSTGDYSRIVVKIHQDTTPDNCKNFISNLQLLLESTSRSVGVASSGRVWPAHYTVVLPRSWAGHNCSSQPYKQPKGTSRYSGVDILVHPGPLTYGSAPMTVQPRGCGQRGEFISLPASLVLTNNNTDNNSMTEDRVFQLGKNMAHQFFKLRFGIFDEQGFPSDPLYPGHFKHQGEILPTGATDEPVKGVWLTKAGESPCQPDREACIFHPQGDNSGVTCSLGYLPQLPNTWSYCRPDQLTHQLAPTKQNVVCDGRSAYDIITSSEDYRLVGAPRREFNASRSPLVELVMEPKERIVLIMESTASMNENDDWKWIQKVAHKIIRYDLPGSVEVGVVSFSNDSKVEHPLTLLQDPLTPLLSGRRILADSIPDKYRLSVDNGRCVICGINTALQDVLGEDKAGAHLVLVTRGGGDTLSLTDETRIKEFILYYQIKLSTLILPSRTSSYRTFYDATARLSGGRTVVVADRARTSRTVRQDVRKYLDLVNGLHRILQHSLPDNIIQSDVHSISGSQQESCGHFLLPIQHGGQTIQNGGSTKTGSDVQFGIVVQDEEDHLIRSVKLIDPEGVEWGPYRRMATGLDSINIKTINYGLDNPPPFNKGGAWQYKILWHTPPGAGEVSAGVLISGPAQASDLSLSFWTSSADSSADIVTAQHPLTLYASVNSRGGGPVLRAKVMVSVRVMMENTTLVSLPPFRLKDNGNGDPDMVGDDGIYSRYMTNYPAAGRYIFTVTVSDNDGKAVAVVKGTEDVEKRCCGSFLEFGPSELAPTGIFNQAFNPPSLNLLQVPSSDDQDRMPPSKIGDFKIKVLPESESLLASWTAPGDDFDSGYVQGYRFVYSHSISQLLDHTQEPAVLVSLARADRAGVDTSFQFKFNFFEEELYIGLIGLDESNNTGKISNIVPVFMPALIVESSPTIKDRSVDISLGPENNDWTMIGALCGAILLLGLFLLLGIIYFLRIAKPKKAGAMPVHASSASGRDDGTDNSSCGSENSKNTSSHRLMPDITTVAGTLPIFQAPPSTLPDSTPTYWSATQLLTEHEQRALNLSYSAIHGPMETIREEYIGYPEEFPPRDTAADPGITNLAFSRNNNGTPVHAVFGKNADGSVRSGSYRLERPEDPYIDRISGASSNQSRPEDFYVDRTSAASSNQSESVISVGSNLYRGMGGDPAVEMDSEPVSYDSEPVRYSTAVQTTAPSTTASLRLNRSRNVSLV